MLQYDRDRVVSEFFDLYPTLLPSVAGGTDCLPATAGLYVGGPVLPIDESPLPLSGELFPISRP